MREVSVAELGVGEYRQLQSQPEYYTGSDRRRYLAPPMTVGLVRRETRNLVIIHLDTKLFAEVGDEIRSLGQYDVESRPHGTYKILGEQEDIDTLLLLIDDLVKRTIDPPWRHTEPRKRPSQIVRESLKPLYWRFGLVGFIFILISLALHLLAG